MAGTTPLFGPVSTPDTVDFLHVTLVRLVVKVAWVPVTRLELILVPAGYSLVQAASLHTFVPAAAVPTPATAMTASEASTAMPSILMYFILSPLFGLSRFRLR